MMKRNIIALMVVSFLCCAPVPRAWLASAAGTPQVARPRIEVCFVLDTTSSMGGLIEGAKAKIWSIANGIISAKPTPLLKVALVPYRDRGDEYVTRLFDLSEDIDKVYADLQGFSAQGGGDGPESVNQALNEAVTGISWSPDREVLKIIFLAGDYPPHMDYAQDVRYPETCKLAVKKDIIINTIQLGDYPGTTPIWREIADLSEGKYVAIGQSGDMRVMATPMDPELAGLNAEMGGTMVAYGDAGKRKDLSRTMAVAASAPAPVAAERLAYAVKADKPAMSGDLVEDLKEGKVALASIKKEELPAELAGKPSEEQQAWLKEQAAKREKLQVRINELVKARQAYLDAEMVKQAAAGKAGSFDAEVSRIIREEAGRKGLSYESAAP